MSDNSKIQTIYSMNNPSYSNEMTNSTNLYTSLNNKSLLMNNNKDVIV